MTEARTRPRSRGSSSWTGFARRDEREGGSAGEGERSCRWSSVGGGEGDLGEGERALRAERDERFTGGGDGDGEGLGALARVDERPIGFDLTIGEAGFDRSTWSPPTVLCSSSDGTARRVERELRELRETVAADGLASSSLAAFSARLERDGTAGLEISLVSKGGSTPSSSESGAAAGRSKRGRSSLSSAGAGEVTWPAVASASGVLYGSSPSGGGSFSSPSRE